MSQKYNQCGCNISLLLFCRGKIINCMFFLCFSFHVFVQTKNTSQLTILIFVVAALQEKKVEIDAVENEKDVTTEKEVKEITVETPSDDANKTTATENGDETLNESKPAEEVTADSQKKPKKEKVKKKWSFRSISFSKKDKQKPSKKDKKDEDKKDEASLDKTTNGDCEKVPEEVSPFLWVFHLFIIICMNS